MKRGNVWLLLLAFVFMVSASAALASIEDVQWWTRTPSIENVRSDENHRVERITGGIRMWVREADNFRWDRWGWNVEDPSGIGANNWQIRITFERLDSGGSGVLFGRPVRDRNRHLIAAVVGDETLTLVEYGNDGTRGTRNVLKEAPLNSEHRNLKDVVLTLTFERDSRTVRCIIGDTEYINENLSRRIPLVEYFGFVCEALAGKPSTAAFKKMERRWM